MSLVSSSIGQSYRAIQDQIPQRTSHDSIPLPSAPSIPDDFDPSTIDWLGMFGLDAPSAEQFDWNTFDLPEEDVFEALNSHAPTTPSCDLLGSVVPPRDPDYDLSPERLHGTPSEIPDGQPFDSPWVSLLDDCGEAETSSRTSISLVHLTLTSLYPTRVLELHHL